MSSPPTIDGFLEALTLEPLAPDRYRARNLALGGDVVFGGQLLAQSVVAALTDVDDQVVKTLHTQFLRGAANDTPLDVEVERTHLGRSFGSRTVTFRQGERICARSMVLLTADEPDLIRHADPAPEVGAPGAATPAAESGAVWEVRVVDGVDVDDPDAVGPAELSIWSRFRGAPDDPALGQALLAIATDGFLIGTAMRPHAGIAQAQAHRSVATSVVGHTLTFHEPVRAGEWLLLHHRSPYAGRGRSHGRADVFDADGALVASFVQDAMIRAAG
jgi:acyl-CoA thioesterase II